MVDAESLMYVCLYSKEICVKLLFFLNKLLDVRLKSMLPKVMEYVTLHMSVCWLVGQLVGLS